jgi:uncharacterized protein
MSTHEFVIPTHDLDAAGKSFTFTISPSWIRNALAEMSEVTPAGPDGELAVRASKSGNDVVVHGTLKAQLKIPCARCLEPADVAVNEPLSVLMVPAHAVAGSKGDKDEYEFTAEEADVLPYSGDNVVLDDLVRDELLLQIPMIPLCSEACPGMSPAPDEREAREGGAESDSQEQGEPRVDPRLAPLLRFKRKP